MIMKLPSGQSLHVNHNCLIIRSRNPLHVLSSAVLNGGLREADNIMVQKVPANFKCSNPALYLSKIAAKYRLNPAVTIGFMTAADPTNFGLSINNIKGTRVATIATAGTSNSARAGEQITISKKKIGTINIIVLTDSKITDESLVNAIQTVTEAKTLALRELDIRSTNSRDQATCTSTDSLIIGTTNKGVKSRYAGVATTLGRTIAETVISAVKDAILKQDKIGPSRKLLDRLQEYGITFNDLEEIFIESYIHHKSMGTRAQSRKTFRLCLKEASTDYNVSALVLAALRLEEDGKLGLIPGLSKQDFAKDPVSLLADEIIGMALSNYIAGSKGLFEYTRFDQKKFGILQKLGPFVDDAIGALVAGATSNVYSKLLNQR